MVEEEEGGVGPRDGASSNGLLSLLRLARSRGWLAFRPFAPLVAGAKKYAENGEHY